jgi:hypothetical protein
MDLSINHPIQAWQIEDFQALSANVYKLVGSDNSEIVIKQEDFNHFPGRKEALTTNLNIMHAVDKAAKVVVLPLTEVEEIRAYVRRQEKVRNFFGAPMPVDLQRLSELLRTGGKKWFKMEVKQIFELDKAAHYDRRTHILTRNKPLVQQFAAALNAPSGLEKLGQIIAVDLFNGNTDRFCVEGGVGFDGVQLRFLVNVGNVMLSAGKPIGLDALDPHALVKATRVSLQGQDPDHTWGGYLLGPTHTWKPREGKAVTMGAFVEGVVDDLETVLGPRNRKLFILKKTRLTIHAKLRLKQGMTSGMNLIRRHLRTLGPLPRLPIALQDKIRALGWIPL